MILPKNCTLAYLPKKQAKLIQRIYDISVLGLSYCYYKRYLDEKMKRDSSPYFIHTINGYYDLSIISFCQIFGSRKEPTHYSKLIRLHQIREYLISDHINFETKKEFLAFFLSKIHIEYREYKKFHEGILKYRNTKLIHLEHDNDDNELKNPKLDIPISLFKQLLSFLINFLNQSNHRQADQNKFQIIYSNTKIDEFERVLEEAMPKLE